MGVYVNVKSQSAGFTHMDAFLFPYWLANEAQC